MNEEDAGRDRARRRRRKDWGGGGAERAESWAGGDTGWFRV